MEYIINFDHVYTAQDLHNAFRKLPLPDYYGNNLDALYDVLCEIGEPTVLTIKNVEELPASYQDLVMQKAQTNPNPIISPPVTVQSLHELT